jgi:hypothetical protein
MSPGIGCTIGGLGACAFARKNFDRKTVLEADVHDFVDRIRLDEGNRVWMRKKRDKTPAATYSKRDRGDAPLYARYTGGGIMSESLGSIQEE